MNCCTCKCHSPMVGLAAYRLKKPIPGCAAGTIFIHDPDDAVRGSLAHGCLKLAWDRGNCQLAASSWCGHTFSFPAPLKDDAEWFEQVENESRYK